MGLLKETPIVLKLLSILFAFMAFGEAFAETHVSDLASVDGVKFPNTVSEGTEPVRVSVMTARANAVLGGYTELLPFALRAPDQGEAGSCLYMSLTGIAEWWLARLNPSVSRAPDGPIDLSERYLMNVAGLDEASNGVANWKTDSVYLFNKTGGALRNADYRFTKGWYVRDGQGNVVAANRNTQGALYDENYNWIDQLDTVGKAQLVPLPKFQRTVLFADPASNQWDTGVAPDDLVERVKTALRVNKAPVHVVYNHFGYWHATVILGYDDAGDNNDCHFVRKFLTSMQQKADGYRAQAAQTKDPAEQAALLAKAAKAQAGHDGADRSFTKGGGCHQGVFYVRDSIYPDPNGPMYDYDPTQTGDESHYVKPIVLLEQDWVHAMANHVTQISVAQ
jgi:hypothetical protein